MKEVLFVAAGGAVGSSLRYLLSSGIYAWYGRAFPWGTLAVNVLGSFAIGLLSILLVEKFNVAQEWRLAIVVGVLGGFTTFSAFSWDTLDLMQQGLTVKALVNVMANVLLCIVAAWLGAVWAKSFV
ncbi:MAG: fluoride efflux transporter CrcB [Gammaproteobacteria bacterium]|nr:fluoride efflux transporter CrcB [Gammaproteobacteria bacterium]